MVRPIYFKYVITFVSIDVPIAFRLFLAQLKKTKIEHNDKSALIMLHVSYSYIAATTGISAF